VGLSDTIVDMRMSQSASKTRKNFPGDETSKNAQLLIQAGFIHKEMAGVYSYLPLGLRVIEKIKQIVREEMNAIGGQEIIMTTLQRKDLWQKTDRWSDKEVDIWFKSKLKNDQEVGLAWSHEEPITDMMRQIIGSYRDLPLFVYQFQNKLRNELRAKSGIMRGREFVMKDLYSYTASESAHKVFYDSVIEAYLKIFERVGLGDDTFLTFASGGAFTQFSHEFQTVTDAGEDVIYLDRKRRLAVNKEVYNNEVLQQLDLQPDQLMQCKAAEVGNIFSFGPTKSQQLGLTFVDDGGKQQHVILGSYGIGITRLMGVVAEKFSDDKGLIWPEGIAPAAVYLARLGDNKDVVGAADKLYRDLTASSVDVIYDDRDIRPGQKFADADLMGIPIRAVISEKTIESGHIEVKRRAENEAKMLDEATFKKLLVT
jgi:prolyl-tRNA synthetase